MKKQPNIYLGLKQLFPFTFANKQNILLLMCCIFLSSCGLLIVGVSAAADKHKKNKVAKTEMAAKKRYSPSKASGLSILCENPDELSFGGSRDLKLKLTITDSLGVKYPYFAGKDPVLWSDFTFEVKGGYVNDTGKLMVYRLLDKCPGGKVTVKAIFKNKPGIDTTLVFDLFMKKETTAGFKGKPGSAGYKGQQGLPGKGGNYGNTDDYCSEGKDGGYGNPGENGGDGPEMIVYIKKMKFSTYDKELIVIKSINVSQNDTLVSYFDPSLAGIIVSAAGGDGGDGGDGGSGGTGGHFNGQSTSSSYYCKAGRGGDAGDGGDGGNGGTLKVYIDPSAEAFCAKTKFITDGGIAGEGGRAGQGGYGNNPYGQSASGKPGKAGRKGSNGSKPEIIKQKLGDDVFK